jgi:quercetin dioxygenase-like cupin family protein
MSAATGKELAMNRASRLALVALSIGAAAILGAVTPAHAADAHHTVVPGDAVTWGPAPPSLPPGAQAAVLLGSPAKEGPFVLRLKFPAGFVVPPHRHSKDEFVTVLSGSFAVAAGEKVDRETSKPLGAGSFVHLPAGMPHYALAHAESVVQINGMGPFDVKYVDPKDDPRNK